MAVGRSIHFPVVSPLACGARAYVGAVAGPGAQHRSAERVYVCGFLSVLPVPGPLDCSLPSSPGGPWRRGAFGSTVENSLLKMTECIIHRHMHTEL